MTTEKLQEATFEEQNSSKNMRRVYDSQPEDATRL
jgi:hypothetical protein